MHRPHFFDVGANTHRRPARPHMRVRLLSDATDRTNLSGSARLIAAVVFHDWWSLNQAGLFRDQGFNPDAEQISPQICSVGSRWECGRKARIKSESG